ncbi:MAG: DNA polymerase III subunit delta', partial [Kiritimatiellae bacterium]|nr:DNA polymerase III subunit delta' [Kiritimatiellia bacterium]
AIARTPREAAEFLNAPSRREARRKVVRTLAGLADDDSWDVLLAAKDLAEAARIPLEDVREAQKAATEQAGEFLSASAMRSMEDANKRALTARERAGMLELLSAGEAVLRDVLIRCSGIEEDIVNEDASDKIARMAARTETERVVGALALCREAAAKLDAHVSPQLVLEDWLLAIKEAL